MGKSSIFEDVAVIIGVVALFAILVVVMPFISFWLSYFGGWVTSKVVGDTLCQALNTLFNTSMFTKEMLPWYAGALGWIGGFFKTISTSSKLKSN